MVLTQSFGTLIFASTQLLNIYSYVQRLFQMQTKDAAVVLKHKLDRALDIA